MAYLNAMDAAQDLYRVRCEIMHTIKNRLNVGENPVVKEIDDLPGFWDKIVSCHKDEAGRIVVNFSSDGQYDLDDLNDSIMIELLDALDKLNGSN